MAAVNVVNRLSKDDYKKAKELEEARKAGTAPPELDEDGNAVNPHIPSYIANAPCKGKKAGPAATKFRKGACTNCGAMTHSAKLCVERPRKVGAKWTNSDIKADEVVQEVSLDYDGKRDRWNGYDPNTYSKVINAFEKADVERRRQKADSMQFMTEPDEDHARFPNLGKEGDGKSNESKLVAEESDSDDDDDRDDSEFKEGTGYNNAPIQKVDPKTRTTIRNLRIREDTAKYLRNLDLDSAYYDPKTRSMRENPNKTGNPSEQLFAGDNFVRFTGDVRKFGEMQSYAWEAYEKGQEVHLQGAPSQAELLFKEFRHKKESLKERSKDSILAKYGGQEHLEAPKELLLSQTEEYIEYSASGKVIKGQEKAEARSKYEEDVYILNHTQVWGSYWENGKWGFACCKQFSKSAYCLGSAGRALREEMLRGAMEEVEEVEEQAEAALADPDAMKKLKKQREKQLKEKKEKEEKEKEERFKKALVEEEARSKKNVEADERKRQYNSRSKDDCNVTEEDMEAYRLKRQRADDPMLNFVGKD